MLDYTDNKAREIKNRKWDERYALVEEILNMWKDLRDEYDEAYENETDPKEKEGLRHYLNDVHRAIYELEYHGYV